MPRRRGPRASARLPRRRLALPSSISATANSRRAWEGSNTSTPWSSFVTTSAPSARRPAERRAIPSTLGAPSRRASSHFSSTRPPAHSRGPLDARATGGRGLRVLRSAMRSAPRGVGGDGVVGPLVAALDGHQPGVDELREVMGQRGLRDLERRHQLALADVSEPAGSDQREWISGVSVRGRSQE
jgi:hypothetical protein